MDHVKLILKKLLYPPKPILYIVPPPSFAVLVFIFTLGETENVPAYLIYGMSAYSLTIWAFSVPELVLRIKRSVSENSTLQRIRHSGFGESYINNIAFRVRVGVWQGMAADFLYVIFRIVTGIRYSSVWFISMAVYHFSLGVIRAYLIFGCCNGNTAAELKCYRRTAWSLFLLNIPMSGMVVLMIMTDSGYFYPGYIIYLSALYAFYKLILSVVNVVKFRRVGNPVLSAAKVLNFISAMMSILGLQTAMIARFSVSGENYRRIMNTLTGGAVCVTVIVIAVYMLLHSRKIGKRVNFVE